MLGVTNLLLAIDKILRMEESQNTDEIESALETLSLIGTSKLHFYDFLVIFCCTKTCIFREWSH